MFFRKEFIWWIGLRIIFNIFDISFSFSIYFIIKSVETFILLLGINKPPLPLFNISIEPPNFVAITGVSKIEPYSKITVGSGSGSTAV